MKNQPVWICDWCEVTNSIPTYKVIQETLLQEIPSATAMKHVNTAINCAQAQQLQCQCKS